MGSQSPFTAFAKFLLENAACLQNSLNSQKRISWEGQETGDASSATEKFNFFSPEFSTFFSSVIHQYRVVNELDTPFESRPLYNQGLKAEAQFGRYRIVNQTFSHSRSAFHAKYLKTKDVFVTAADDGCLCVWSIYTAELIEKKSVHGVPSFLYKLFLILQKPINHLEVSEEQQLIVTTDVGGGVSIIEYSDEFKILHFFELGREVDVVQLFAVDELKLFLVLKDGPYLIFTLGLVCKETFRSSASYQNSALLVHDDYSFMIVKTSAGLFSINFSRITQETWFLDEEDPIHLLSNENKSIVIALCAAGKAIALAKTKSEGRPQIVADKTVDYDFSSPTILQIFDNIIVFADINAGSTDIHIFSIDPNNFFKLILFKRLSRVCYLFSQNKGSSDHLFIATVDGSLLDLDIRSNQISQELHIHSSLNHICFSDEGRIALLLDDIGSITFIASGALSDRRDRLKILNEGFNPRKYTDHLRLKSKIDPDFRPVLKRRKEPETQQDRKRVREQEKAPENNLDDSQMPYWTTIYLNQAQPFVPQLGDEVLYFPKPHFEFLRRNGRKLKEKVDYEDIIPADKSSVGGIIEEIEYIPADIVKCHIKLKVLIGRKSVSLNFNVFFGISQPNFLILKSAYIEGAKIKFKVNETVKIHVASYQNENGIILEVADNIDPLVIPGAYKVLCKKRDTILFCSHWELSKLRGGEELALECLSPELSSVLDRIFAEVMTEERWTPFRHPVNFSEYPEYYAAVPYPMYLELIQKRLLHRYYRQLASFLWDIRQIAVDAMIFNEEDSDIVLEGHDLVNFVEAELKKCKIKK